MLVSTLICRFVNYHGVSTFTMINSELPNSLNMEEGRDVCATAGDIQLETPDSSITQLQFPYVWACDKKYIG